MPYKDKEKRRASNMDSVARYRDKKGTNSWWKWTTEPAEHWTPEMRRQAIVYQDRKHARLHDERQGLARPEKGTEAWVDFQKKYHSLSTRMFYCRERMKAHMKVLMDMGETLPDTFLQFQI